MFPEIIPSFEVADSDTVSPFQLSGGSSDNGGSKMHLSNWKGLHPVTVEGERKQAQGTCCFYFMAERTVLGGVGGGFTSLMLSSFISESRTTVSYMFI